MPTFSRELFLSPKLTSPNSNTMRKRSLASALKQQCARSKRKAASLEEALCKERAVHDEFALRALLLELSKRSLYVLYALRGQRVAVGDAHFFEYFLKKKGAITLPICCSRSRKVGAPSRSPVDAKNLCGKVAVYVKRGEDQTVPLCDRCAAKNLIGLEKIDAPVSEGVAAGVCQSMKVLLGANLTWSGDSSHPVIKRAGYNVKWHNGKRVEDYEVKTMRVEGKNTLRFDEPSLEHVWNLWRCVLSWTTLFQRCDTCLVGTKYVQQKENLPGLGDLEGNFKFCEACFKERSLFAAKKICDSPRVEDADVPGHRDVQSTKP